MMRQTLKIILIWLFIGSSFGQAFAYTTQFADDAAVVRLRWKTGVIPVALSNSLIKPNPYIKADSDVAGAVERSLRAWEKVADIKFQPVWTDKQTVSEAGKAGDGISLITVAPTAENLTLFGGDDAPDISARTRLFFNRRGNITEADIVLNPYEQFSTDGTVGTYDLESTLTHELGHLLGLEHSSVIGATMHTHTGKNGVYNLPEISARTLGQDDISGARALYGASGGENCCGVISGKLTFPDGTAAKKLQVWAETADSGRIAAAVASNADGSFKIEGLSDGRYKVYAENDDSQSDKSIAIEKLADVELINGKSAPIVKKISGKSTDFDLRILGFNGQLAELAVLINGGKSYVIYVGGRNLKAENLTINFTSPYLTVTPESLTNHDYGTDISVISFEVNVAADIPLGEYGFSVKSGRREAQTFVGGLTVERFANPWNSHFLSVGKAL